MSTHEIKCWTNSFQASWDGLKPYEMRINDRDYKVGDTVYMREWDPARQRYLGRGLRADVTYITFGPSWGVPQDMCILALRFTGKEQVEAP